MHPFCSCLQASLIVFRLLNPEFISVNVSILLYERLLAFRSILFCLCKQFQITLDTIVYHQAIMIACDYADDKVQETASYFNKCLERHKKASLKIIRDKRSKQRLQELRQDFKVFLRDKFQSKGIAKPGRIGSNTVTHALAVVYELFM